MLVSCLSSELTPICGVDHGGVVDTLYDMLQDGSSDVVAACVAALDEIMASDLGMKWNEAVAWHVVQRVLAAATTTARDRYHASGTADGIGAESEYQKAHVLASMSLYLPVLFAQNQALGFSILVCLVWCCSSISVAQCVE
jgi:hypothetical protein